MRIRKEVRKPRPRTNSRGQARFTRTQLQWWLEVAYTKDIFWFEYVHLYYDLFVSERDAKLKAKTHSLGAMSLWLLTQKRCEYNDLYDLLVDNVNQSKVSIVKEILDIDSKPNFIHSIEDLSRRSEKLAHQPNEV